MLRQPAVRSKTQYFLVKSMFAGLDKWEAHAQSLAGRFSGRGTMRHRTHWEAPAIWIVVLALTAAGAAAAAGAALARQEVNPSTEDELEEVVVTGRRASDLHQNPQIYFDWLARLVGDFTVEGYVDVTSHDGSRDVLTVEGTVTCIGFGAAPAVQCDLHVRWPDKTGADGKAIPGEAPTLDPSMMLFGFKENGYNYEIGGYEISEYSIKHVLVDNRGVFESAHAVHDGEDTVVSTSHCAAIRADCERMVRITASPDLSTVEIQIELTIEQHKAVRYAFLLSRVPGSKATVYGRKAEKGEHR
jgi:hypothetical protein